MYAAEHYGAEAVGITLSVEQAALARERIAAAGLSRRCRVEVCDYRDIPDAEQFDKIASVGMIEHVGHRQFPAYFGHAYRSLRPGGLFFHQGIVRAPADPVAPQGWLARRLWREDEFVYRYVFPNGELVPLAHVIDAAEQTGLETRDVENLREHYARTVRQWIRRLEANYEAAVAIAGEATYRVWRLYLAGSAYGFASGGVSLAQMLFSKPGLAGQASLPLTRADLYASPQSGSGAAAA
jgi:cyclopropane-fatty-acyl-phospholipid synthase